MPARQSARAALLPSHPGRFGKADYGTDGGNQENTKYEERGSKDEVKAVSHFVLCTSYFLLPQRMVRFQNALIHHYKDSGLARLLRRAFVNYAFLHPDDRHPQLDGFIHHLGNKFRAAEDIHDVDLFRYRGE